MTGDESRMRHPKTALRDESGSVTIDWVILAAAVVMIAIGSISSLEGGVEDVRAGIATHMDAVSGVVEARRPEFD